MTACVVVIVLPCHHVADSVGVDLSLSSVLLVVFPYVSFYSSSLFQDLRWDGVDLFCLAAHDYGFCPRIPLLSSSHRCLGVILRGRRWFQRCLESRIRGFDPHPLEVGQGFRRLGLMGTTLLIISTGLFGYSMMGIADPSGVALSYGQHLVLLVPSSECSSCPEVCAAKVMENHLEGSPSSP
ncbi:hypothetical protein L3X38_025579 [Prunus dulcis]|uniref:Uncharacterized protein n=1 Tax=Prunus dulcis TaxID=3755 RepID=A0AAD4W4H1_PRUDU|nr:hypothetical protein L3X38_025579 [Prunus dulcis]